jgi:hypothetical protein
MAERQVESPVTRKGSKVGSNQPLSPGARSDPGRSTGPQADSVPAQSPHTPRHSDPPIPASSPVVIGPE